MNQTTLLRRRVLLGGLTMPALVPIARARAQGAAAPPPTVRAPFGLTWGMSENSARRLETGGWGDASQFWHLPLAPKDSEWVHLFFGYRDRLFQVDAQGTAELNMTRYKELSSLLSELYGSGTETVAAQGWFGRADPNNRSLRETWFRTGEVSVLLSLLSGSGNVFYWTISYWHLAGLAEFQADDHSHKKDAL